MDLTGSESKYRYKKNATNNNIFQERVQGYVCASIPSYLDASEYLSVKAWRTSRGHNRAGKKNHHKICVLVRNKSVYFIIRTGSWGCCYGTNVSCIIHTYHTHTHTRTNRHTLLSFRTHTPLSHKPTSGVAMATNSTAFSSPSSR